MERFHEIHTRRVECDRRKRISIKEKGKRYLGINNDEKVIAKYHLDDPEHPVEGIRCDYALYVYDDENQAKDDDRLIFIELKGSDIEQAIQQISNSIRDWVVNYSIRPRKLDARIISSGCRNPQYYKTNQVRLEKELNKYGQGNLIVATRQFTEEL
ncbi:hypothetical protein [Proteiniphilum acetatigenes]|uniref:hypothetical protein n=1 Tax=Proteiniphilum acetatigenes TaxID=294710 RepID=UPI000379549B|nr:hypothetical protein [Proteiniphilum acetatigenes]